MPSIASRIGALTGWRRLALAGIAGALSVLTMAPFFLAPILFATFPVLVWLLDGCAGAKVTRRSLLAAGWIGWAFGFGYFLAGLYWIGAAFLVEAERFGWLLPFAVSLLPAGLALFYAGAAALAHWAWRPGPARLVALAGAMMALDLVRGSVLSGFPWNAFGYALATDMTLLQAVSLVGVFGLTPVAVMLFAAPACLWCGPAMACSSKRLRIGVPLGMLILVGVTALWGVWRLAGVEQRYVEGVRLRIVQPNIPQREKWLIENRAKVFHKTMRLSAEGGGPARDGLDGISHLIWPESAVPFLLADTGDALSMLARMLPTGTSFILGAARGETERGERGEIKARRIYNSIFVMNDQARLLEVYDKVRLVPFGEYLPLQGFLEAIGLEQLTRLRGGFAAGDTHGALPAEGAPPFSPLICYEVIFPHWVRGDHGDPGWLLNLTNDAWFGQSSGPYQHFHQARVRAVEQGLPVVRAANTGISATIDAYGRVVARLGLDEEGALDTGLPAAIAPPPFVRWGRAIEAAILGALLAGWFWLAGREREV